ncbi:MAG: antirestriction protein ArdA [Henriciella sp.]|nr:antirestriction protein ArdA [Henriciella sp.]
MNTQSQQNPEQAESTEPRIYVACLAAYNNGHLHGHWIDAEQGADDIQSDIAAMLAASPIPLAEEWAIHDHEGFEGGEIGEYTSVETVAKLADFIAEHGELGGRLLAHFSGDLEDAEAAFEHYAGQHKSLADFAQELTEETTEIPQSLVYYIDYAAMARDMELNGDLFTIELGFEDVRVFWSR